MDSGKNPYVVEMEHITKTFGEQLANDDVNLTLRKGEIHALLGENGAGKSTLMNILFGLVKADSGRIKIRGEEVDIKNPNDATAYGIGMVHQHFRLVESFTVHQNIILGAEDKKYALVDLEISGKKIEELSRKYQFEIDLDAKISDISVGMQQRVEILKMLYRNNDVLIFDEPTAVLTPQEIEQLLKLMKGLADSGKCILFITHKLNEIKAVADRCSVLRKGRYVGTYDVAAMSEEELSEKMVGRKVNLEVEKSEARPGKVVLSVENLKVRQQSIGKSKRDAVHGVSFKVRAGEIVCIAGIDGNGQSELIYALTGLMHIKSGRILLNGEDITKYNVRTRTSKGIAHIPEDRLKYGLVEKGTIEDNMILQSYYSKDFQKFGFLKQSEIRKFTDEKISEYDISAGAGAVAMAGSLSGGNQQKVVVAREISREPELIIASQPIRGLDVGAIEFIHNKLLELRDSGKAVLLVSFELSEVMNISDRILVMTGGEIAADLKPEDTTPQELGLYMAGAKKEAAI